MKKIVYFLIFIGTILFSTGCSFNEMINSNDPNYLVKQVNAQIKQFFSKKPHKSHKTSDNSKTKKLDLALNGNHHIYGNSKYGYIYPIYLISNNNSNKLVLKKVLKELKNKYQKINESTSTTINETISNEDRLFCGAEARGYAKTSLLFGKSYNNSYQEELLKCLNEHKKHIVKYATCKYQIEDEPLYGTNFIYTLNINVFHKRKYVTNRIKIIAYKLHNNDILLYLKTNYRISECGEKILVDIIYNKSLSKIKNQKNYIILKSKELKILFL